LQTATTNPAEFLGLSQFGTIQKGKRADLILLEANPLAGINNIRKITGVLVKGRYLSRSDLDRMLEEVEVLAAK
jgi:imidazolonepropionase-like amidohydrolase